MPPHLYKQETTFIITIILKFKNKNNFMIKITITTIKLLLFLRFFPIINVDKSDCIMY